MPVVVAFFEGGLQQWTSLGWHDDDDEDKTNSLSYDSAKLYIILRETMTPDASV